MMRPFTILCFFAFAGAGAWLYHVKHQVALKERELAVIRRDTEGMRQRLDILRAEWALLNEPERLRQTAMRVVALEPMQPTHFARFNELDRRLPAAVAFAGAPDLFAPPPGAPRDPAPVMVAAAQPRGAAPAAAPAAPPPPARAAEAPAPQALAAAVAQQRAEQASRAEAARAEAAARTARAAPQAAPQAALAAQAPPRPNPPAAAPPAISERPTRLTQAAPAIASGSVLGTASALGRPLLAPPVPVSPAAASTLR
jgi:hypothetical protein